MNCPFLKEARVRYCAKAALRKMIRSAPNVESDTCSSPRHTQCAIYRRNAEDSNSFACPYLRESLAQYCAKASVPRLVPYSEPLESRCGEGSYRYCEFYAPAVESRDRTDGGIHMPNWLHYSANHMWIDASAGGACHLGLDAFFTSVLGAVERITFIRQTGVHRPSAVLTVHGMDLEVVFPTPVRLTASNRYLSANPSKITADPYGTGWLFRGVQVSGEPSLTTGLIHGDAVLPWLDREISRVSAFLAECRMSRQGIQSMNDGGVFSPAVFQQLSREEALQLFHEFFWGLRV
jgi:glycine cleavage system H protein